MSTAPLDLKIAVIGANKLDALVKRMDVLEQEVARLNKTLPKASNNIKKVGTSSAGAARQTSAFAKAVGGLATAFASIQIGAGFAEAVNDARALELSGRRLKLLTTEYKQYVGVQAQAERLAAKFQVSVADSSKALFSLGSRLGAQGTTLDEIVSVYEGLNSALIVTGRSAQEAASANYQLSQALGSGKLTGDELRTIVETLPELLNEIAKQAGKSASQIRQMAKDGELTTDIIIKATKALGEKYADAVKDSITVNQRFGNSIQGVSEKIGKSLLPVVDPLQETLIEILNTVIELPDPIIAVGTAAVAAAVGIGALQTALSLLGLPGVISLFGKLAIALAGFTGVTTTAVTGFTAAGAAIKATTLVVTAQTVALGALKLAFLAIPYAAIAAGLFVIVKAFSEGINKAKEWEKVLRNSGAKEFQSQIVSLNNQKKKLLTTLQKLKDSPYYRGMKGDIAEIKKQVKELDIKIDEATRRRKLIIEIETILGRKGVDVQSLRDGFYGPGGSAGVVDVELPTVPTGGDEDTGKGSAPRASDAPQLQRDLKLAQDLFALNSELMEAELDRNKLRIEGIQITKIGLETAKEIADVTASDLYDDEKVLAIKKLKVDEAEKLLAIQKDGVIAERDKEEELQATLRGLQEQIDVEGALTDEMKLKAEWAARIAELTDQYPDPERRAQAEAKLNQLYSQRLALLDPLVQYQRELEKNLGDTRGQIASLARTIESELGTALSDAITGLIDGTTTVQEAFSNMFANIGKAFIDMATQMLAQKAILMLLGAFTKGPSGPGPLGPLGLPGAPSPFNFAGGGYTGDGPRSGGIDGQGGFPAILHPQETVVDNYGGRGAMNYYGGGSDGANGGGSGTYKLETVVINNVEYATVEQVRAMGQSSARQGAAAGNAMTMNNLRNSRSQRSKIGLGGR